MAVIRSIEVWHGHGIERMNYDGFQLCHAYYIEEPSQVRFCIPKDKVPFALDVRKGQEVIFVVNMADGEREVVTGHLTSKEIENDLVEFESQTPLTWVIG